MFSQRAKSGSAVSFDESWLLWDHILHLSLRVCLLDFRPLSVFRELLWSSLRAQALGREELGPRPSLLSWVLP